MTVLFLDFLGIQGLAESIYFYTAAISSAFIILRFLGSLLGAELDHDFELHFGEAELGDLSFSAFAVLFSVFGWAGFWGGRMTDFSPLSVFGIASIAGFSGFISAVLILNKLKKLENSGNTELKNAVGAIGEVYLTIPENDSGQVKIVVQGKQQILNAASDGERIPTGEKVYVYEVENGLLKVVRHIEK
jgi:membrane-bound ClpP family serine protease